MAEEKYDTIILGGGPAGLTAGIYTARHGLKTLILDSNELGGRALQAHRVENFPGFPEGLTGRELMERFVAQAERFGVDFSRETAIGLSSMGDTKVVMTRKGLYEARTVIVATGIQRKQLSVPGEMEYKGRGVSYCAICDGPFFAGKVVAVVGPGEEAVEEALRMAEVANKVYAIPGKDGYKEGVELLEELRKNENIEVVEGVNVKGIVGDSTVTQIELDGGPGELKVDGVFIVLNHVSTSDLVAHAGIRTDESGCILVDREQRTNIKGVFAAGDCVCGGTQIVTAAGEGGRAALSAMRYIRSLKG